MSSPTPMPPTTELATLLFRQWRFVQMRFIAVAAIVLAPLVAPSFETSLPMLPLFIIAAALALMNVLYLWRLHVLQGKETPGLVEEARRLANVQTVVDLILLTVLIHFTGGIENPLLFYYVLHVIIAGIMLPYQSAYAHATLGILMVLAMQAAENTGIVQHQPISGFASTGLYQNPPFIAGTLFVFVSTVYLAAYLSTSVSGELRKRQVEVSSLNSELADKALSLQKANDRLVQVDRQRAIFLAIASHDLRAPIAAALSLLDNLGGGYAGRLSEKQSSLLDRAERRLRELLDLADGLLSVSRIEQGQLIPDTREMAFEEVVKETLEEMSLVADPRDIRLIGKISPDLPLVVGSPTRLRQVLTNLIHNAIKFTPAGGSIVLRAMPADSQLRIELADSGTGIDPSELGNLFQDFFRPTGVKGAGSGIGLFIAKRIVDAHGGQIWAESPCPETGVGTKFVILLPATLAKKGAVTQRLPGATDGAR